MCTALKALASITAWILFVVGLLALVMTLVRIMGAAGGRPVETSLMTAYFGVGIAGLFLSVVSSYLRIKMQ